MEAVVISDVFGTKAGAYMATLLLCRALDELDINVTCFTTWVEPEYPVASEGFAVVKPLITRGYRWDWPNRCLASQAVRHIKKVKPTLVVVMGVTRLSRYLLNSSIANRLLIWELTDACGNKFVDVNASRLLPRCKAMLSPSNTVDCNITEHYHFRGAIHRLPFWVEDLKLPFEPRTDEYFADFVYFGRRDEEKGLRELIEATVILATEHPEVRVVIGGVGDAEPFASIVRDLNIERNIVFGTFPSRHEVGETLVKSRCLVLPSYHEGYPLVLLEAVQSSLPFIATDVGSIREVFGGSKACIIVEPRDPVGLAQGMKQMLIETDDAHIGRRMAAFQMFNKLSSTDRVAENLSNLLQLGCQ